MIEDWLKRHVPKHMTQPSMYSSNPIVIVPRQHMFKTYAYLKQFGGWRREYVNGTTYFFPRREDDKQ